VTGRRAECGQATVELVAVLPLVVVVALAAGHALAAGAAAEMAAHASHAGAAALLQGGDPERAAREALPDWSRSRLAVEVKGRRVSVEVRPVAALPGLAKLLTAEARADAGPRP
jgi:hypothetical protein